MEIDKGGFHKNCGEILRLALALESHFDFFISNYFSHPQTNRTHLLQDELVEMNFQKKIEMFKKICKEENIEKELVNDIINSVDFVKKTRNKVAHWQGIIIDPKEGILLQKRKTVTYKKDETKITPEFVKEVDKKQLLATEKLTEIYLRLSDHNYTKKIKIV